MSEYYINKKINEIEKRLFQWELNSIKSFFDKDAKKVLKYTDKNGNCKEAAFTIDTSKSEVQYVIEKPEEICNEIEKGKKLILRIEKSSSTKYFDFLEMYDIRRKRTLYFSCITSIFITFIMFLFFIAHKSGIILNYLKSTFNFYPYWIIVAIIFIFLLLLWGTYYFFSCWTLIKTKKHFEKNRISLLKRLRNCFIRNNQLPDNGNK